MTIKEPHFKKIKFVDEWLWIPWKVFVNRRAAFIYDRNNYEKVRERQRLFKQESRKRKKQETINRRISIIYWHEVNHPTKPIRQYIK